MRRWTLLVCVLALAACSRAQNGVCGSTGTKTKCSDAYFADFKVDPFNCGGCHNVCAQGISCCYGQCQDCPGGSFKCANNVCTNLQTDPQNCGQCGAVCASGMSCINGACGCPTDKPTYCGGCTNTLTDNDNCGTCFKRCFTGWSCISGVCTAPPSPSPSPSPMSPSPSPNSAQPSPSPTYPSPSPKSAPCLPACKSGYSCTNNQCMKIRQYPNPKINGVRIDFCLSADRSQCGPPVADAFCKAKGYTHAQGYSNPVTACPTFYVGSLQNCRRRERLCSCSAFSSIFCIKVQPGWDQVSAGPP